MINIKTIIINSYIPYLMGYSLGTLPILLNNSLPIINLLISINNITKYSIK